MNYDFNFISLLYIGMMISCMLVTIIYVYSNWNNGLFGRLMSITLILICYGLFTSFNAAQGFLIYFPHLARTGYLILLIVTPLLYLNLKNGLANKPLNKKDYTHFLPSLLYFINFIPFFILSKSEKIQLIQSDKFLTFQEGWLFQKYFVLVFCFGQTLFYLIIGIQKILIPSLRNTSQSKDEKKMVKIFFIYLILLLLPPITSISSNFTGIYAGSPVLLTYISSQTIFFLLLLNQPNFIYKKQVKIITIPADQPSPNQEKTIHPQGPKKLELDPSVSAEILILIMQANQLFDNEKPYLDYNFGQNELCEKLNVSNYQIRAALKNGYFLSFNDFVNHHRISFLIEMLKTNPKWGKYNMATLAKNIGFKSTNSLYLAFKKFMHCTPKEFIDQLEN